MLYATQAMQNPNNAAFGRCVQNDGNAADVECFSCLGIGQANGLLVNVPPTSIFSDKLTFSLQFPRKRGGMLPNYEEGAAAR